MSVDLIGNGRVPTICDQCGRWDDHPKVHLAAGTVHHDCLSVGDRAMIAESRVSTGVDMNAVIEECLNGTRGADLVTLIEKTHDKRPKSKSSAIKFTTYANDVLDQTFNNGASGTDVIGPTTYTLPYRCQFLSTVSTAAAKGTEWTTSGGYTAGGVSIAGLFTTAAAAAAKANTGAVTVANAPAQTWADNAICDSTGTPKNLVAKGTPSLAKTVNAADTCTIPISQLTGSEV